VLHCYHALAASSVWAGSRIIVCCLGCLHETCGMDEVVQLLAGVFALTDDLTCADAMLRNT
jgi:hypothetical protein